MMTPQEHYDAGMAFMTCVAENKDSDDLTVENAQVLFLATVAEALMGLLRAQLIDGH